MSNGQSPGADPGQRGHVLLAVNDTLSAAHPAQDVLGMVMLENNGDSGEALKLGVRGKTHAGGIGRALMAVVEIAKKKKVSITSPLLESPVDICPAPLRKHGIYLYHL